MGRAEFVKFFGGELVQTMTPKGHFEINWPLDLSQDENLSEIKQTLVDLLALKKKGLKPVEVW